MTSDECEPIVKSLERAVFVSVIIAHQTYFADLQKGLARKPVIGRTNFGPHANSSKLSWAVVVAQLAKRSPPTPKIRRSNPNVGNNFSNLIVSTVCNFRKDEKKGKRGREWPI